ncbi:indole-3-glycerol phosphate synthase TrpC [Virgibacillus flavescens]|uniref:indole-3-glycerol phosphate synthase TrpC n=1 Tax=Virgibacillus flavescens TaxID=1611422 RepID=UPI003D3340B0
MTILEKILAQKKIEVEQLKSNGFERFETVTMKYESVFPKNESMHIIAEIKRASPSKGAINMNVDPVKQAKQYEQLGASAISVLTDKTFFNGSMSDLHAVREAVDIPLLCKDFMIDEIQIDQAKNAGATIILLIVAALSKSRLQDLYNYAKKQNLEVLCEVHDENEMEAAIRLGANIIGINNRNLKSFEVDLNVIEKLSKMVKNSAATLISESGIKSREDVERIAAYGAQGILIGETLMRSTDLTAAFQDVKIPLKGVHYNAR